MNNLKNNVKSVNKTLPPIYKSKAEKEAARLINKLETKDKKINLCISNKCFLKCYGCYNNFCHKKEIDYEKISDFLEYAKEKGLERVTLSGGDPLARIDIVNIIKRCIDLELKVNLDTVGLTFVSPTNIIGTTLIINKFEDIDLLKKISMIGIPLDGSSNKIISTFRTGIEDLFERQIEVLNFFEKEKIDICINTVYHKQNEKDIKNIYNIIKKYKCVKKWQVFQYMPIGPLGKTNEDLYCVRLTDFIKTANYFQNISNENMCIEFKPAIERENNYMLINSSGVAYKVNLDNNEEIYGNIQDKSTWDEIISHLN